MRQVVAGNDRHIIAVTEVDRLRIGHRNAVVAGAKRQRIDAVTEIDGKTVLSRIKDQRLVTRTANQLGITGLRAVGIEVLREDAPVAGAVVILILRFPSDNKAAVGKRCHHRILLRLIRLRAHLELIANRDTAGVIALGEDPIFVTVLIVACPGDNKTVAAQAGHRRVILRTTCVRIGLEQIAVRDRRVIIRSRNHRELLTKHRPVAVIEPGTQLIRAGVGRLITPGDNELAVVEAGHRGLMLIANRPVRIDHELVANRVARSIELLAVNVVITAVAILIIGFPDLHKAAIRERCQSLT